MASVDDGDEIGTYGYNHFCISSWDTRVGAIGIVQVVIWDISQLFSCSLTNIHAPNQSSEYLEPFTSPTPPFVSFSDSIFESEITSVLSIVEKFESSVSVCGGGVGSFCVLGFCRPA